MPAADGTARALGYFSIGLGTAHVLAPSVLARLIGVGRGGASTTLLRLIGLRELAAGVGLLMQPQQPSPWLWARVAGDAMDLSLLGVALGDGRNARGRLAFAFGAVAAITAADVRSAQESSRERDDDQNDGGAEHVIKAITIRRPPTEVYQFWRNFRNFPSFMSHLDAVAVLDERTSHWTARGPAGRSVEWDAEITEDRPNELLAWQSRPGADVANAGRVRFARAPGDGGTEVRVDLWYSPPGGTLGSTVARLFGQEPRQQVQADLRKLKEVMETGEVIRSSATLAGTDVFQRPAQPAPSESATGARS